MNQDLLIRLFRSFDTAKDSDALRVASLIIEDEEKKGHERLANKLRQILGTKARSPRNYDLELRDFRPALIPGDKRNNVPLATLFCRDELRHEMVLDLETEKKINRIEKEFGARDRLAHHGLKYRQKILIYGAPGCGKSMSAERIAWNLNLPFLKVRFDAIISSFLGETAANLTRLFESIKSYPSVLLLDEFDIIGKTRIGTQDVGEMHRTVNVLLSLLEDFKSPGLLIATTNVEQSIDLALFRRFDDIIEMPKPSAVEILRLAQMTVSSIDQAKDVNWGAFVKSVAGASSAIIVKIANDAAKLAVISNDKILTQEHFQQSLKENAFYLG